MLPRNPYMYVTHTRLPENIFSFLPSGYGMMYHAICTNCQIYQLIRPRFSRLIFKNRYLQIQPGKLDGIYMQMESAESKSVRV